MHWAVTQMGLKAHVRINVSIHLDDEEEVVGNGELPALDEKTIAARFVRDGAHAEIKYPLAVNHVGVISVVDKAEAERVMEMLGNHVNTTFLQMGVKRVEGTHKPKLEAAFGGVPEPKLAS